MKNKQMYRYYVTYACDGGVIGSCFATYGDTMSEADIRELQSTISKMANKASPVITFIKRLEKV